MSFCCRVRVFCGNVFTDPLPSNGYTRHSMFGLQITEHIAVVFIMLSVEYTGQKVVP
jgi:hypothetical protein